MAGIKCMPFCDVLVIAPHSGELSA